MNTRKRSYKIFRMTALGILTIVVFSVTIITSYQYLRVTLAAPYTPASMPLNLEIVGSGDKDLVFIHGLTGSKTIGNGIWMPFQAHINFCWSTCSVLATPQSPIVIIALRCRWVLWRQLYQGKVLMGAEPCL